MALSMFVLSLKDLKIMPLRNILTPSILLFALVVVGCTNKKETVECDQTKFDCTPKTTEVAVSEPVAREVVASEPLIVEEEVIETANVSNEDNLPPEITWEQQKKIINKSFKPLIKDEINNLLNADTDTWVIDVRSVKDGTGKDKGFVIYKYDVTSSSPDHDFLISAKTCTAKAQISSEDNKTPMAFTLDTDCYKNLEGFF